MNIGIMGAMPEEIDGIKNSMGFKLLKSLGNRDYYHKETNAYQFFLVFSRWGKVAASSTATTLINEFNVDMIMKSHLLRYELSQTKLIILLTSTFLSSPKNSRAQ